MTQNLYQNDIGRQTVYRLLNDVQLLAIQGLKALAQNLLLVLENVIIYIYLDEIIQSFVYVHFSQ